jgi:L-iditol 2-dehydrogenase
VRAARLHAAGDLRVGEEPAPEADTGMSLVRVTAVGICGSDLHWWDEGAIGDATLAHPLVLGHEGAGVIAEGPRRGERVAIDPAIACGTCRACRDGYENLCYRIRFAGHGDTDGMMRELMAWPTDLLHPLPDGVSAAEGAMLEPLGVALHSADLGHLPFAGTASVVGCGPIGLLLIGVLKAAGASSVLAVEPLAHRREAAARAGADLVVSPGSAGAELVGAGVDVAFEAAGTDEGIRLAMESVRPGGRVVLAGIPGDDAIRFQASVARRKGLTIAMVRRMNRVYPRAISLATRGVVDLGSLVSSRAGLASAAAAFGEAARRTGLKVLIEPLRCAVTLGFVRTVRLAVVLDLCCVLAFVIIGRASHAHGESLGGIASTAWPFLAGLACGWLAVRGWQRPLALAPSGVAAWLGAAGLGMVFRVGAGQGTAVAFVLVALALLGLFLLGWRALARFTRLTRLRVLRVLRVDRDRGA